MKKILIITLFLLLIYYCFNRGEIIKENHYEISMRRLNYGDNEKISNIEDINFDNGNIIIKLKSLQNNLYLETIIIYYKEKKIGEISINENLYVESISNSKYIDINSYIFEYPINNDLLWILGEKNEKYNISSGPYMENEFIFETIIKDKANNKIYNLKREIDILFVEQGKIRRWTFDH